MQNKAHSVSAEIVNLIEATVREAMMPFGLQAVRVRGGEDHDGDPVIFVDVDHAFSENPIDPAALSALLNTVRDLLWDAGELRFPHIWHHFDEHQQVKERPHRKAHRKVAT